MKNTLVVGLLILMSLITLASQAKGQGNFIWVAHEQESKYPGYRRVIGGRLNNGTELPVCRAVVNGFNVPGKFFDHICYTPWHGKEVMDAQKYEFFLTKAPYSWKQVHDLSRAQIEKGAVWASPGQRDTGAEYICRKQMSDGMHSGKYAIGNATCYVSWGGKEYHWTDSFEIMFP